jgi:uncharacterized protein (DUF58 family)
MLTERGWAGLGAGVALGILWIGLGELELLTSAIVLISGVGLAIIVSRLSSPEAAVTRQLRPNLVHEGDQASVAVRIRNTGRRALRNVVLEDTVSNLGSARFAIGKLGPGAEATASYQILCRPRGIYVVGPAALTAADPLRLASISNEIGEGDRLIVYPSVEELEGFPMVRGLDPSVHAAKPEFSHRGGEDFFTLREYRIGDDLRRVHWPSSAKRDKLMIRQLETPWQARALVMLDARASSYENSAAFERAVRGAASVVRHLLREGFSMDLWAGGAPVTGNSASPYANAMEALAGVEQIAELDMRAAATHLRRGTRGGALVMVTGIPDQELLAAQRLLGRDFGRTIVLSVSETPSSTLVQFQRIGAVTVHVAPHEPWAPAWLQGVRNAWATA